MYQFLNFLTFSLEGCLRIKICSKKACSTYLLSDYVPSYGDIIYEILWDIIFGPAKHRFRKYAIREF